MQTNALTSFVQNTNPLTFQLKQLENDLTKVKNFPSFSDEEIALLLKVDTRLSELQASVYESVKADPESPDAGYYDVVTRTRSVVKEILGKHGPVTSLVSWAYWATSSAKQ